MIDPTSKEDPKFKELVKVRRGRLGWNVPVGAKL